MDLRIDAAEPADAEAVCAIYNHYVEHSTASFEIRPVEVPAMAERMVAHAPALPWRIARLDQEIVGYAFASPWKAREAYRYSVESSIYVAPGRVGQGIGSVLYRNLLGVLTERGLHTAIASIALPNASSVRLHEALGFVPVGRLSEAGFKFGRWVDMGYWQRRL